MLQNQFARFLHIWISGGWTMIPLLLVAIVMYTGALNLIGWFRKRGHQGLPEATWRGWVDSPKDGRGEIGEIIRYAGDEARSTDDIQDRFSEITAAKFPVINGRLQFLTVLVNVAPLLGLLGTVLGMLATFHGISAGGGKAMDVISSGISEALITTEMGLLIAIPGYVLCSRIKRKRDEYEAFLAHVESTCVQAFKRRQLNIRPAAEADPELEEAPLDQTLATA